MSISRRTALKASAWSVPIIAVAVAAPLAAASVAQERIPVACTQLDKNWWRVQYNDGAHEDLHQGAVNSDKRLQALCRDKGPLS